MYLPRFGRTKVGVPAFVAIVAACASVGAVAPTAAFACTPHAYISLYTSLSVKSGGDNGNCGTSGTGWTQAKIGGTWTNIGTAHTIVLDTGEWVTGCIPSATLYRTRVVVSGFVALSSDQLCGAAKRVTST